MSAPDPQLRSLYARLEEVLGAEHAETLMTHLPSGHEYVTKADLHEAIAPVRADIALLTARFDGQGGRFEGLEGRFDGLEGRFEGLEGRFDGLEGRFDRMEDRFDRLYERIDDRLEGMHTLMHTQFRNYSVVAGSLMTGLAAVFGIMLAAFG
jgi:hypothetical protein